MRGGSEDRFVVAVSEVGHVVSHCGDEWPVRLMRSVTVSEYFSITTRNQDPVDYFLHLGNIPPLWSLMTPATPMTPSYKWYL